MSGLSILLPLIPNVSLVALPIILRVSGMLRYMLLFMPDIAWIALICGSFAAIWTFLRTGLMPPITNMVGPLRQMLDRDRYVVILFQDAATRLSDDDGGALLC